MSNEDEKYQPFWYRPGCLGCMMAFGIYAAFASLPSFADCLKHGEMGGALGSIAIPFVLLGWSLFAFARNTRQAKQRQLDALVDPGEQLTSDSGLEMSEAGDQTSGTPTETDR
jgi:hypothetical protein